MTYQSEFIHPLLGVSFRNSVSLFIALQHFWKLSVSTFDQPSPEVPSTNMDLPQSPHG